MLLRVLDALADGLGHFACLAQPDANMALAVTDNDDRAEREAPAALDHLGNAVDLDDTLLERETGGIDPRHDLVVLLVRSRVRLRARRRPGRARGRDSGNRRGRRRPS